MFVEGVFKNYDWGMVKDGIVYEIYKTKLNKESDNSFAEYWLGFHNQGEMTSENPKLEEYKQKFPFLFKILSIRKPLSIQVHPNKNQAEYLHKIEPDVFKDNNHKPEMAIALTKFSLLGGFKPKNEIEKIIQSKWLFRSFSTDLTNVLPDLFTWILNFENIQMLQEWKSFLSTQEKLDREDILFLKLMDFFPNDRGCMCAYVLNYIQLEPYDAIFIPSGVPHAYISGECIEVMACSDNVIRAGLTPKHVDVAKLLCFTEYEKPIVNIQPVYETYVPPVDEFQVSLYEETQWNSFEWKQDFPCLLFVLEGTVSLEGNKKGNFTSLILDKPMKIEWIGKIVIFHKRI